MSRQDWHPLAYGKNVAWNFLPRFVMLVRNASLMWLADFKSEFAF